MSVLFIVIFAKEIFLRQTTLRRDNIESAQSGMNNKETKTKKVKNSTIKEGSSDTWKGNPKCYENAKCAGGK